MTALARCIDIFVAPGEVFEEVRRSASASLASWFIPLLSCCMAGVIGILAVGHQRQAWSEIKDRELPARNAGLLPAPAPQAAEHDGATPDATLTTVFTIIISNVFGMFWSAGVIWFLGRSIMKVQFPFMKALEVVGLASTLLVLNTIITALLVIATDDIHAQLAPSLLVKHFDPANFVHSALAMANPLYLWMTCIMAIGLARLTAVPLAEAAFWVFLYWFGVRLLLVSI